LENLAKPGSVKQKRLKTRGVERLARGGPPCEREKPPSAIRGVQKVGRLEKGESKRINKQQSNDEEKARIPWKERKVPKAYGGSAGGLTRLERENRLKIPVPMLDEDNVRKNFQGKGGKKTSLRHFTNEKGKLEEKRDNQMTTKKRGIFTKKATGHPQKRGPTGGKMKKEYGYPRASSRKDFGRNDLSARRE